MSKINRNWIQLTYATAGSLRAEDIPYDGTESIKAQLDAHGSRHEDGGGDTVDHNSLVNTHNLTTDIDHDSITNTHNLTTDIDHGSIEGLGDDDHTQYSLVAGTRAFTGVVSGITPTLTAHLATKGYVDSATQGIGDWQESVLDRFDPTSALPVGPSTGDRYLSTATANGWTANNIYEYNGSTWDETVASEGMATWVEDEDKLYMYNGSAWVIFGSTQDHGALQGLGDDDHAQYLLAAGSRALSADWDIGLSRTISAEKIQARSALGLSLYDDGGNGIHVEDGGNVGIGTTDPTNRLEVIGGTAVASAATNLATSRSTAGVLLHGTSNSSTGISIGNVQGEGTVYLQNSNAGGGTAFPLLLNPYGGYVGIGITNPAGNLHVKRNDTSTATVYIENNDSAVGEPVGLIRFRGLDSGAAVQNYAGINGLISANTASAEKGRLDFEVVDGGALSSRMSINGSNVGIGTTNPANDLEILASDNLKGLVLRDKDDTQDVALLLTTAGDAGYFALADGGSYKVVFNANASQNSYIDNGGNLGIGTTNPTYLLDVNSDRAGALLRVENTDSSGYGMFIQAGGTTAGRYAFRAVDALGNDLIMVRSDNGRVGIGTNAPSDPLDVVGNVEADGFTINGTPVGTSTDTYWSTAGGGDIQYSGGNVGIGITNPTAPLVVSTTTIDINSASFINTNNSGGYGVRMQGGGTTTGRYALSVRDASNAPLLEVKSESGKVGFVGIGTNSPTVILDIVDSTTGSAIYHRNIATANITNSAKYTQILETSVQNRGVFEIESNFSNITDASRNSLVQFQTADAGTFATAMAINGHNVGIGTTDPSSRLEVYEDANAPHVLTSRNVNAGVDAYAGVITQSDGAQGFLASYSSGYSNSGYTYRQNTTLMGGTGTGGIGLMSSHASGKIAFFVGGGAASTEKMRITADGNVGIGTTDPAEKLHIYGTSATLSIQCTNSAANAMLKLTNDTANVGQVYVGRSGSSVVGHMLIQSPTGKDLLLNSASGDVGIGTTNPSYALHAYRASGVSHIGTRSADDNAFFIPDSGTGSGQICGMTMKHNNVNYWQFYSSSDDSNFHLKSLSTSAERLTIAQTTGNIGIGTTNPSQQLNMVGGNFLLQADEGTNRAFIVGGGDTGAASLNLYDEDGTQQVRISAGSSTKTFFNASAVGIGTTNPGAPLEVREDTTSNIIIRYGNTPGSASDIGNLYFQGGANHLGRVGCESDGSSTTGALHLWTNAGAGVVRRLSIDNSGRVGIGSTNPVSFLDVVDPNDAGLSCTIRKNGGNPSGRVILSLDLSSSSSVSNIIEPIMIFRCEGGGDGNLGNLGSISCIGTNASSANGNALTSVMYLKTRNAGSESAPVMINASGFVGIGTTSPVGTLHAVPISANDGTISARFGINGQTHTRYGMDILRLNCGAGNDRTGFSIGDGGNDVNYFWTDDSANFRVKTNGLPTSHTDGTVVGTQTSLRELKQDITLVEDYDSYYQMVLDAPLNTFKYIKEADGYGEDAKERLGFVADEVDDQFMDMEHIDQVSVNGMLMACVKKQSALIDALEARILDLENA